MIKNTHSRYTRRILAGGFVVGLAAMLLGAASAQSGKLGQSGDIEITTKGQPVGNLPCDSITKLDDAFRQKIDESIFGSVDFTLTNLPSMGGQHLSSGENPWLNEFARNLAGASQAIGTDVAMNSRASLAKYLDRVTVRMCTAITQELNWPPPLDLDKKGQIRQALCQALEHYYPRVQARVTDTLTQELRLELTSRIPQIPMEQAALMGPGEKQRIESELTWFVEALTRAITDTVDADLDGFYDRVHARHCE